MVHAAWFAGGSRFGLGGCRNDEKLVVESGLATRMMFLVSSATFGFRRTFGDRRDLTAQAHAQTATDQQNAEHDRSDHNQIKPDHKDARGRVVRVVGTFSAELSESVADLSLNGAGHIRSTVVFRFFSNLFGFQQKKNG